MQEKWFEMYFSKLQSTGVSEESINLLREKYGESLKKATFAIKADSGYAYDGSLLEVVIKKVTSYAIKMNEMLDESIREDKNSIIKVCFLCYISMAERVVPSSDAWRKDKLGEMYTYKNSEGSIGIGLHSVCMATECGITFTPKEIEAMTILDRSDDDRQAKFFSTKLSTIVKSAFELAFAVGKDEYKKKNQ